MLEAALLVELLGTFIETGDAQKEVGVAGKDTLLNEVKKGAPDSLATLLGRNTEYLKVADKRPAEVQERDPNNRL
jgi:hypothetical protein